MKPRNTIKIKKGDLSALVDLNDGLNVFSLKKGINELISFDKARYIKESTYGIPLLYPTPNRVNNNKIAINGDMLDINMHGLLIHHKFTLLEKCNNYLIALARFEIGSDLYNKFPFDSSFIVKIILDEDSIKWEFTIENHDTNNLSFGLGIHPFFVKEFYSFNTNVDKVMMMNKNKLPTGLIKDVSDTKYKFSEDLTLLNRINVDDVFIKSNNLRSNLVYPFCKIAIVASPQFNHLVIYTNKDAEFACIEPQTSSTDCHNLDFKGYQNEANLQTIKHDEIWKGFIKFSFTE